MYLFMIPHHIQYDIYKTTMNMTAHLPQKQYVYDQGDMFASQLFIT